MEWAGIYKSTVSHLLPKAMPYADNLQAFIVENHIPISSWIKEAEGMLQGFTQTKDQRDLAMLAAMMESSSMVLLPAYAIADLVVTTIDSNSKELAIRARSYDGLRKILPLESENAKHLSHDMARWVIKDVMRGVDWMTTAAYNKGQPAGKRIDLTSDAQWTRMKPICTMAACIVEDVLPFEKMSQEMNTRLAA